MNAETKTATKTAAETTTKGGRKTIPEACGNIGIGAMDITRARLLQEMGISPVWRLRRGNAAESPETEAEVTVEAEVAAVPETAYRVPPAAEPTRETSGAGEISPVSPEGERGRRIATLPWPELETEIRSCTACGLCAKRKQAVPGVGDRKAQWLFIGEGPGAEEDIQGEPFVGQAGKLLDSMLAAIGLKRGENVYIANAVKCRPPGNRTPETAEVAACWPYLQRQIDLIRPRLIVLLGRAAVRAVLDRESALGALRGREHAYRDGDFSCPVLVTYHPAYLLRNLPDKIKAWEDLCLARRMMARNDQSGR